MKNTFFQNPRTLNKWNVETSLWRAPDDGQYLNLNPGFGLNLNDIDRMVQTISMENDVELLSLDVVHQ